MAIREITEKLRGVPITKDSNNPSLHQAWEILINEKILILKRYGSFCRWNKLTLEKDSREVYRIEHNAEYGENGDDEGLRKEFFDNNLFREYIGNRFSFVEYVTLMGLINKFPNHLGLTRYLRIIDRKNDAREPNKLSSKPLEQSLIDNYKEKIEKILS